MKSYNRSDFGRALGWRARRVIAAAAIAVALFSSRESLAQVKMDSVAAGSASLSANGAITTIRASDRAIINYHQFDVAAGTGVNFIQPSASARVLNRINSASPSYLNGNITANGQLYFINPSGIVFGRHSQITSGGLVAAAAHLTDADFLAGVDHFTGGSGLVRNDGSINASTIALLGLYVQNTGTLSAPDSGIVTLAAGKDIYLQPGEGGVLVKIAGDSSVGPRAGSRAGVENSGSITAGKQASLGAGDMYSLAIRHSGKTTAPDIHIEGQGTGIVHVSGTLDASSKTGKGGTVEVTGQYVGLTNGKINADGATGGGTVLIGGDWKGGGTLRKADEVVIAPGVTISASATRSGNGGTVVAWSKEYTYFGGKIRAEGSSTGLGGQVETSADTVDLNSGTVSTRGGLGAGNWLIDPINVSIYLTKDGSAPGGTTGAPFFDPTTDGVTFPAANADFSDLATSGFDLLLKRSFTLGGVTLIDANKLTQALETSDIEISTGFTPIDITRIQGKTQAEITQYLATVIRPDAGRILFQDFRAKADATDANSFVYSGTRNATLTLKANSGISVEYDLLTSKDSGKLNINFLARQGYWFTKSQLQDLGYTTAGLEFVGDSAGSGAFVDDTLPATDLRKQIGVTTSSLPADFVVPLQNFSTATPFTYVDSAGVSHQVVAFNFTESQQVSGDTGAGMAVSYVDSGGVTHTVGAQRYVQGVEFKSSSNLGRQGVVRTNGGSLVIRGKFVRSYFADTTSVFKKPFDDTLIDTSNYNAARQSQPGGDVTMVAAGAVQIGSVHTGGGNFLARAGMAFTPGASIVGLPTRNSTSTGAQQLIFQNANTSIDLGDGDLDFQAATTFLEGDRIRAGNLSIKALGFDKGSNPDSDVINGGNADIVVGDFNSEASFAKWVTDNKQLDVTKVSVDVLKELAIEFEQSQVSQRPKEFAYNQPVDSWKIYDFHYLRLEGNQGVQLQGNVRVYPLYRLDITSGGGDIHVAEYTRGTFGGQTVSIGGAINGRTYLTLSAPNGSVRVDRGIGATSFRDAGVNDPGTGLVQPYKLVVDSPDIQMASIIAQGPVILRVPDSSGTISVVGDSPVWVSTTGDPFSVNAPIHIATNNGSLAPVFASPNFSASTDAFFQFDERDIAIVPNRKSDPQRLPTFLSSSIIDTLPSFTNANDDQTIAFAANSQAVAAVIAGSVPTETRHPEVVTAISGATARELNQIGIHARGVEPRTARDALTGMAFYNDVPLKAFPLEGDVFVTEPRLPARAASALLGDYHAAVEATPRVDSAGKQMRDPTTGDVIFDDKRDAIKTDLDTAYKEYVGSLPEDASFDPTAFRAWLDKSTTHMLARDKVKAFDAMFEKVETLGLSPREIANSKSALVNRILPSGGMTADQLRETIEAVRRAKK